MRILLTNDDGVAAPGLALLAEIAATFSDDVWIVAPAEDQSGAGHSLTISRPLRLRKVGERRFAVVGTPTDAVLMALGELMKDQKPDLILSGINRGANLAEDVTYSGTASAAMEGALAGIPSIALSQAGHESRGNAVSFDTAREWGARVIAPLIETRMAAGTLVNVNFPADAGDAVKGIRLCRQGRRDYGRAEVVKRTDPRGFSYYWLGLGPARESPAHDTDLEAIADGWVSVTPLHLDMTHDPMLAVLRERFSGSE